jgi:hypothetical protein
MIGRKRYQNRIELLQGTLDMLILQTLQWGPNHGYGIVQSLRVNSKEALQVETGSLYPALHRLERQDWVPRWTDKPFAKRTLPPLSHSGFVQVGLCLPMCFPYREH